MVCLQEAGVTTVGNCVLIPQGLEDMDFVKELRHKSVSKANITM